MLRSHRNDHKWRFIYSSPLLITIISKDTTSEYHGCITYYVFWACLTKHVRRRFGIGGNTQPAGSGSLVHGTPQMTSWHTWWKMGGASGIELNSRQAQRLATIDLSSNRLNFGLPSVVCLRCAVSTRNLNKPGELCKVPRTLNIEPKYGETRRSKYDNTVHVCVSEFTGLLSHTKPPGVLKVRRTDWSPPGL